MDINPRSSGPWDAHELARACLDAESSLLLFASAWTNNHPDDDPATITPVDPAEVMTYWLPARTARRVRRALRVRRSRRGRTRDNVHGVQLRDGAEGTASRRGDGTGGRGCSHGGDRRAHRGGARRERRERRTRAGVGFERGFGRGIGLGLYCVVVLGRGARRLGNCVARVRWMIHLALMTRMYLARAWRSSPASCDGTLAEDELDPAMVRRT